MKNLKFNKKRLTALLLAGNILLFSGCDKIEKKDECKVITPYSLSNTFVVTRSDGTVDIAKKVYINESIFALHYEHKDHDHYKSLLTGDIYSTNDCDINTFTYAFFPIASTGTMIHYSQLNSKNISDYLTEEEMIKIKNGEFTKLDENNILKRIMESNVELENVAEDVADTTEDQIAGINELESDTENVTDTTGNQIVDINENVKTYSLKELYFSETSSPLNNSTMPYIFLQMDYNPEYYREYHGEFFTVDKDSYSARSGYENNFQDWNPEFVISDSIEPLSEYLTEEEIKNSKAGQLTELQLDFILARIRSDYKQQSLENNYSKNLTK